MGMGMGMGMCWVWVCVGYGYGLGMGVYVKWYATTRDWYVLSVCTVVLWDSTAQFTPITVSYFNHTGGSRFFCEILEKKSQSFLTKNSSILKNMRNES